MKEIMKEKMPKCMENVMAALHARGVTYNCNSFGFSSYRKLEYDENTLRVGEDYKAALKRFNEIPGFHKMAGDCWYESPNEDCVLIRLSRLYNITDEDMDAYVSWCGCSCYEEAQCYFGDIPSTYKYLQVEVRIDRLEQFVQQAAKYCW